MPLLDKLFSAIQDSIMLKYASNNVYTDLFFISVGFSKQ